MSTSYFSLKNRTIVLFFNACTMTVLVSACSTLPRHASLTEACPPTRTLVCDTFGPESRCRCSDRGRVDRQLDRVGMPALSLSAW
jgi:hypothetical protein